MDARTKIAFAFQHQAQAFLRAAAQADHDVARLTLPDQFDQRRIFNPPGGIVRRQIAVRLGKIVALRLQPRDVLVARRRVRHDPQHRFARRKRPQEQLDIPEAGHARNFFARDQPPEEHHQRAVRDDQVGVQERLAVGLIGGQFHQRRCRRHQHQAARESGLHRRLRAAREKADAENVLEGHFKTEVGDRKPEVSSGNQPSENGNQEWTRMLMGFDFRCLPPLGHGWLP